MNKQRKCLRNKIAAAEGERRGGEKTGAMDEGERNGVTSKGARRVMDKGERREVTDKETRGVMDTGKGEG